MKTAIIFYNLGGPLSLDEVGDFLYELFSDREILSLPYPLRKIVARLISKMREKKARQIYEKMGGFSPLLINTLSQAEALEKELGDVAHYKTFIAMRYGKPRLKDTLKTLREFAPDGIIHLPLYPQYSRVTSGSSLDEFNKLAAKEFAAQKHVIIDQFAVEPFFIQAICEKVKEVYKKAEVFGEPVVLLSAHGVPESVPASGDPYQKQCEDTAQAIKDELNLPNAVLCYQSKVGPMKWIGPSTLSEILKAAAAKKPIVIVPIAFISEHSETIVELGMENREIAVHEGAPFYDVVGTVGVSRVFIKGLAEKIKKTMSRFPRHDAM